MNGVQLIAKERKRQQTAEGYDWRHDDSHDKGEIAQAAAVYALPAPYRRWSFGPWTLRWLLWPRDWAYKGRDADSEKFTDVRIHELAKAGALIAAEIDRLKRTQRRRSTRSAR